MVSAVRYGITTGLYRGARSNCTFCGRRTDARTRMRTRASIRTHTRTRTGTLTRTHTVSTPLQRCKKIKLERITNQLDKDRILEIKNKLEKTGFEPVASYMRSKRSTTELHPHTTNTVFADVINFNFQVLL